MPKIDETRKEHICPICNTFIESLPILLATNCECGQWYHGKCRNESQDNKGREQK